VLHVSLSLPAKPISSHGLKLLVVSERNQLRRWSANRKLPDGYVRVARYPGFIPEVGESKTSVHRIPAQGGCFLRDALRGLF
jgi:hypothetical protein